MAWFLAKYEAHWALPPLGGAWLRSRTLTPATMSTIRFNSPPHLFDAHTHRLPQLSDKHFSVYNLRLHLPEDTRKASLWLTAHPWVSASVGIHPWDSMAWTLDEVDLLTPLLTNPQIVALGECGLDRLHNNPTANDFRHQLALLDAQATLAQQYHLPLILHCVKAFGELLQLRTQHPNSQWIIHGFRGKCATAEQLWRKGIATSFGAHYHDDALQNCPPHLRYHESDESSWPFEQIIAKQLASSTQTLSL